MSIARKTLIGSLIGSTLFVLGTAFLVALVSFNTADPQLKKQTENQLISGRSLLKEEIENYLHGIENNIITYSNNEMIVNAADQFTRSFGTFKNNLIKQGVTAADLKAKLETYYINEFGPRYKERNPGTTFAPESLLDGLTDDAIFSQYYFIQNNPNPLGEKDAMIKAELNNSYARDHERFHPYIRQYLQQYSYYDIFIIEPENGTIIYSVFKELDYGTSLLSGPFAESGLADVFRQAVAAKDRDAIAFSPFKPYTPSYEDPASFIASPIKDLNGKTIAVLAFQMPIDKINELMTHTQKWLEKGFGKTGETYMLSEDFTIQNLSRSFVENPDEFYSNLKASGYDNDLIETIKAKGTTIGLQRIENEAAKKALAGETGYGNFTNYAGESSLVAYTNLTFQGYQFALINEKAEQEAFAFRSQIVSSVVSSTAIITIVVLSIIGLIVWRLTNGLSNMLNSAVNVAETVAKGERAKVTHLERKDEVGSLMRALELMQSELICGFEQRALETARITQALDEASTSLMLADSNLKIIYKNKSVNQLFTKLEEELTVQIGRFDASEIMSQHIDMASLRESVETQVKVGDKTLNIIANPVFDANKDRIGTVVEWKDLTEILAKQEAEKITANENARIRQALDNVSSSVMVADAERKIIYANGAVIKLLREAQSDLRKELSHFDVDTMVGKNIDIFHKNPSHQIKMLDSLSSTHEAKISVGGRKMRLTLNPVNDAQGNRLGTVVEWLDQTQEIAIQDEIDNIIASANDGQLDQRIELDGKSGFFRQVSHGLNTLLDKTASFVEDMGNIFGAMAEGDLTKNITNEYRGKFDEIKSNANQSVKRVTEVMSQIQEASSNVHTSANEVAQGSDDLSRRTESQASSLEETASSMEELTETVKQSAENATKANELANNAKTQALSGREVVQEAVKAMSDILDSSNKISDIIGVIDEIAFQTNLLALNAAVEAARAGEQGRGFAVVANEVGTLSHRSAAAAKEIKDLIRESVGKVESGSVLVNQSGQTLSEIVSAVEKVALMISEVSTAAQEQNIGITQVNQAISQMDEMTQQNAAMVEESSAASRSMSEEANKMNNMIDFFKLNH